MTFLKELLNPKGRIEAKLAQYEKEGKIGARSSVVVFVVFALFTVISALWIKLFFSAFYVVLQVFLFFLPLHLVESSISELINILCILLGLFGGASALFWSFAYVSALSAGCKYFGGNPKVRELFAACTTVWRQILVIAIAVTLILLGLGEAAIFVLVPLLVFVYARYILGIIAVSQGVTYLQAFYVHSASVFIMLCIGMLSHALN